MKEIIECHEYDAHFKLYQQRRPIVFHYVDAHYDCTGVYFERQFVASYQTFEDFVFFQRRKTMAFS